MHATVTHFVSFTLLIDLMSSFFFIFFRIVHIDISSQLDNTILAIYNAMILATCPNVVEERAISCLLDTLGEQDVDFADILTKCWRDTPEEKSLYFASQQMVQMSSITPQDGARVYWYIKSNAGRMFDFLRLKRLIGRSWTKQGS